ncbi:transketolase [Metamycoplasma neophronis]|uniref:Transketolase n=1 Tax=Metamycoplasma neophronis TaxID=872983 RepID=A0ABY2Z269_9BACT|nr:transketolase [Metamycoplasma neophronis]TPR54095.1 transketolase [Metamycoplasma neophronis]
MKNSKKIDQLAVDNLKINALAAISKAQSGHSSITISAAKIFHALFFYNYHFDIKNPNWVARDRFVLSASQASALYYAMLRFCGLLSREQLEKFAQIDSDCKGSAVKSNTLGIDLTTAPLGQGIAMGVGLAISEAYLENKFPEASHYTYVLCSWADLQEGVAQEALAYAAENRLNKLIILFDSNGSDNSAFLKSKYSVDLKAKYTALNFNFVTIKDASARSISKAIKHAKHSNLPTIIEIKTAFGENIIKEDIGSLNGKYLEEAEIEELKDKTSFQKTDFFEIYSQVETAYKQRMQELHEKASRWTASDELLNFLNDEVKENINDIGISEHDNLYENAIVLINNLADKYNNILLASTNISSFNKIKSANGVFASNNRNGRALLLGLREFAMASITNGLASHSNIRPIVFCALTFSNYMLPAIRMSAIMKNKVLYVLTHDSVLAYDKGPSMQAIEQLAQLRSIPNLEILRPCDDNELRGAFEYYFNNAEGPVVISISEDIVKRFNETSKHPIKEGAYYLLENASPWTLISTGRDIEDLYDIANELNISLISASNIKNLNKLDFDYNRAISYESLTTFGWSKFAKYNLGVDSYVTGGNSKDVAKLLGIDKTSLKNKISKIIENNK